MKSFRVIEACGFLLLGVAIDRLWLKPEAPAVLHAPAARTRDSVRPTVSASLREAATRAHRASEQSRASSDASDSSLATKPAEIRVQRPKNDSPILGDETEARLEDLIHAAPPRAAHPEQTTNPDGSVDAYGKTEDGKSFYRHFDPKGELTKEGWNDPSGERVHRSYYESGQLKSMNWDRADGGKTTIGFRESGLYEYRWDRFSDGTELSTNYDDAGHLKDVYRKGPDGKPVRVD